MAVVVRLEAEQRSGSTGDGFLLCMCTDCRHMLFIFPFQNSQLETWAHWHFAENPSCFEKVAHLAEFRARPVKYPLVGFSSLWPSKQGFHLALLRQGFTLLFSGLSRRSAGHWRFSSGVAVLALCFTVAALRAFSGSAVVWQQKYQNKGDAKEAAGK